MTRPSPARLLALATAHQRAGALAALIELGIPTLLGDGPQPRDAVAQRVGADPIAIGALLEAAVALGVLVERDGGYGNSQDADRYLRRDAPHYLGDLLLRHDRVARSPAWREFPERLRGWRAGDARFAPESVPGAAQRDGELALALLAGDALADDFDVSRFRHLLDLGGGTGGIAIALCGRHPDLRATIVERQELVAAARERAHAAGLAARVTARAGDLLDAAAWPAGVDLVLVSNVLSMLPAARSRQLFARAVAHLPAGGAVLVSGWMPRPGAADALAPLLLSLEDIALGAPDIEHSVDEVAAWLADAGFAGISDAEYFPPSSCVCGYKPAPTRAGGRR